MVGVRQLSDAGSDRDAVDGHLQTPGERVVKGVTGGVQLLMTAFGISGAAKGMLGKLGGKTTAGAGDLAAGIEGQELAQSAKGVAPKSASERMGSLSDNGYGQPYGTPAPKSISTGRTVPNSLNEQLAMEEVMANPGGKQLPIKMSDTANNLLAEDGWVKMAQNVNGVEIHYVKNTRTGQVVDFKFKD